MSASAKPSAPRIKVRADLGVSKQLHGGQTYYVVKDPVNLRYFRMSEPEYAVYHKLDGTMTIEEVLEVLQEEGFKELELEDLVDFIRQLKNINFIDTAFVNEAEMLYRRAQLKREAKRLRRQVKHILFIKIPLWDPDKVLAKLEPWLRFAWTKWSLLFALAVSLAGLVVVISQWREVRSGLSGLLSPANLLFFWVAFILVKVVHEFGHGLTCKHFGGEVHEMGILFLVFFPCLYCNVSDAWTFPSRWKRFLVSFSGILIELVLASGAVLVWYFAAPGLVQSLAYRIMILCSVSSIAFNANPLMRFDGYYILCDLMGRANLRPHSFAYLGTFTRRYLLRMPVEEGDIRERESQVRLVYGIAASIWLALLLSGIAFALIRKFPPLGIWILGSVTYGMVFFPMRRGLTFMHQHQSEIGIFRGRAALVTFALLAVLVYGVFVHPFDVTVTSPCVLEPYEHQVLRTGVDGFLREVNKREGDVVLTGEVVAQLENPGLELALDNAWRELEVVNKKITLARGLQQPQHYPVLEEEKKEKEKQLQLARERVSELALTSPLDGVMLTPRVEQWLDSFLRKGDPVCEVGSLDRLKVAMIVEEQDVGPVEVGKQARVKLRAFPGETFVAEVGEVAPAKLSAMPNPALSAKAGGDVVTLFDFTRGEVPRVPSFKVTVVLDNREGELKPGMTGRSRIVVGKATLARRLGIGIKKKLKSTFRF